MLAGAPPFLSEGFGDILMMHVAQPPRPLREIDPEIPPAIEAVVLRALEKDRDRRFADMTALKSALEAAAEREDAARRGGAGASLAVAALAGGTLRAPRVASVIRAGRGARRRQRVGFGAAVDDVHVVERAGAGSGRRGPGTVATPARAAGRERRARRRRRNRHAGAASGARRRARRIHALGAPQPATRQRQP